MHGLLKYILPKLHAEPDGNGPTHSAKYRKSGLTAYQAEEIKGKVKLAFEQDKIYRQNDIGLMQLSEYISHDRYKVSEVLNCYFAMNFYALLNHYRIEEAKMLLLSKPFMSVKSVMYEVGFNSKNSFYTAFRKNTGLSPNDYRSMWAYMDPVQASSLQLQ
ncbi:MAG: helix-turn-helix domain-containing protein [Bacteroidota bacterium]